jgi:ribosome modulation factor
MKRQKRSRSKRAEKQGYQAGINKKGSEECPYHGLKVKERWLGGWRQAREDIYAGLTQ